ncbi:AraC family transcriptional regulator ligand-binding domain-containing protein [Chitinimonas sp.]|uniref:AraC family transcriptional regulator n=1 Tax=Chitinimonas sp. TaxID=1934313 RepID=UPI0035B2D7D1
MLADCYGLDTALIPARHQPLLLLEHAGQQAINSHVLLKGSGLFEADLQGGERQLSPAQLLTLLGNIARQRDGREASFLLGQQWLPGHYGNASLALTQAGNLQQALDILQAHQAVLCPLLGPRYRVEAGQLMVYWTDSCGAASLLPFLVELHMTALTALCRWQSGQRLPWHYRFNRTPPQQLAHHQVHLGPHLQWNSQFDCMLLDAAWLQQPWPRGNERSATMALRPIEASAGQRSLLQALYDYLLLHIRQAPVLEDTAAAFGVSPATFKRHLARHHTHFQAQLDQVRTHVAICLMHYHGMNHSQLADYLGYHDARNFRRSFQRWTGLPALPAALVQV